MPSPEEPAAASPPVATPDPNMTDMLKQQRRWLMTLAVVLCVVLVGVLTHLWLERQEISRVRKELARRLQTGDNVSTEVRGIAKSTQDTVLDLQTKVAALESRQAESFNQHTSLEQMYRELAKNRDDRLLADLEQILLMANQQLQLTSNVHGALLALENADKLLARTDTPQFIGIRRAIAKDIERLRAVPYVDVTGMAVKLDAVIAQIGTLQLLSDAKLRHAPDEAAADTGEEAAPPEKNEVKEVPKTSWFGKISRVWKRWTGEFMGEMRQLVHVRNVETPEALILSPSQAYFLRESLSLRLLGARVAMMARDHTSFVSDMKMAIKMLDTYFDPLSPQVKSAKTTLSQVLAANVKVELPTLSDSLTAVQAYRTKS